MMSRSMAENVVYLSFMPQPKDGMMIAEEGG